MSNRRYQGPRRGHPPQVGSTPHRGRGNSHEGYSNAQRQEGFREIPDSLIAQIRGTQVKEAIPICITTRGIGLAIVMMFRELYCFNNVPVKGTIYQFYRVYLACLECKLILNERKLTSYTDFKDYVELRQPRTFVDNVMYGVDFMPDMISRIINSVGNVKVNGRLYVPKIAADRTTDDGLFLPDPGRVTLGNLRRTVVALADVRTPLEARRPFCHNNTIPGCMWRGAPDDPFLENADEIIPEDYNVDTDLANDVSITRYKLLFFKRKDPNFVTGNTNYQSDGSKSILACNKMENLRVMDRNFGEDLADYYKRLNMEGNVSKFYNIDKLSPAEQLNAAIILCGEHPSSVQGMYPAYATRDFRGCCQTSIYTYQEALGYYTSGIGIYSYGYSSSEETP